MYIAVFKNVFFILSVLSEVFYDEWWAECAEQKIPYTDKVNLRGVLGNEVLIQSWSVRNLPSDSLSVENGITKPRYPRHFDGVGGRRNQCTTLYLMQYTGCIRKTPLAIF